MIRMRFNFKHSSCVGAAYGVNRHEPVRNRLLDAVRMGRGLQKEVTLW